MTVKDLIEVLQQSPELTAPVMLQATVPGHDWVLRSDISDVTFDELEQIVVLEAE